MRLAKKSLNNSVGERRKMVQPLQGKISIGRQCQLLGLARGSYYYRARAQCEQNVLYMHRMDELYTQYPFFGSRRMTQWLRREGHAVGRDRIQRLMRQMGLEAIYPRRNLSQGHRQHRIFPYLLRGLAVERPDQVWCSDITYLRLSRGFLFLTVVLDWFSRYVLSWQLSNTLESRFCVLALEEALRRAQPQIFNTDQGSQFTGSEFTSVLGQAGVRISMDGRGRYLDNIFVERFWRTLKYEDIYLREYATAKEASEGIARYLDFYNHLRPHQALGYRTPAEVHAIGAKPTSPPIQLAGTCVPVFG